MKVFVLLAVMVLALGTFAFAETTDTSWDNDLGWVNGLRDYAAGHGHSTDYEDRWSELYERQMELGIIVDVTVYEDVALGIPYALGVQSQYDFNNSDWGFYGKISLNLSPMVKKLTGLR